MTSIRTTTAKPAIAPRRLGGAVIKLKVKAVPGSSGNRIEGWLGDTLKVRVTAPAERGKANAAVEETLARALGVPRDSVRIVRGAASPRKVVEIAGISEAEIHRRIAESAGS